MPDHAAISSATRFPPDAVIERNGAVSLDARHGRRHDCGALGGRDVARLERESTKPAPHEVLRQIKVAGAPLDHILRERHSFPDFNLPGRCPFCLLWVPLCVEMRAQYANCVPLCQANDAILT